MDGVLVNGCALLVKLTRKKCGKVNDRLDTTISQERQHGLNSFSFLHWDILPVRSVCKSVNSDSCRTSYVLVSSSKCC